MHRIEKAVGIDIYSWAELEGSDRGLFLRAIEARENAQAPYSHYKVGCAVLANTCEIFTGVNVERSSWTQTTHAEQNAIDSAITKLGSLPILKVVVVGAPEDSNVLLTSENPDIIEKVEEVCPSCGHCLQIILENSFDQNGDYNPNVKLMGVKNGQFYITTLGDALPMPFSPQCLGINYVEILRKAREKDNQPKG